MFMLYASAGANDINGVAKALAEGAEINSRGTVEGWTALMCAARNNHVSVERYLLSRGANPDLHGRFDNQTALSIARRNGCNESVSLLEPLTMPDGPNNPYCHRPLFDAIRNGQIAEVRRMLETRTMTLYDAKTERYHTVPLPPDEINSLQIDDAETWVRTPLLQAWNKNDNDMIRLLVEYGANVNWQDASGDTILSCVARDGNVEMVKYLLEHGATWKFKQADGKWFIEHPLPLNVCRFFESYLNR